MAVATMTRSKPRTTKTKGEKPCKCRYYSDCNRQEKNQGRCGFRKCSRYKEAK